ncbi:MAG TPA: hypothetical protein VFT22_21740 [Kofleriaceae bacterium]|nr:hypothetical protein [Kofleriaceae bacterium]
MADLPALLAAVVDAPTDDAPRLAYARAVAASDPERAELIELQLAVARARRTHTAPPAGALDREHRLIRDRGAAWAADLRPLVDKWQYLRGFVEVVTLPAAAFLARAAELYRRAPVLHLDLTGVQRVAAELFASPHLARIVSLKLAGDGLGDAEAKLLAASPHLARLEWLDLSRNQIGAAGLEAIAASSGLPRLGYLGFAANAVPDPTPQHADEYDADSGVARQLQGKYGPRAWLSARPRSGWPPPRDAVEYP